MPLQRKPFLLSLPVWGVLIAGLANAGDWELVDSVSFGATAVQRDSDNEEDAERLVFTITPSFHLKGEGRRVSGDVKYGLTAAYDADDSESGLSHSLRGQIQSEIVEEFFFLNATAFAGLTSGTSTSASVDAVSPDSESVQKYSFSLAPIFQRQLGRKANLVSRNRFSYSGSDDSDDEDTISRSLNLGIESGRGAGRTTWFAGYTNIHSDFDTREETVNSLSTGIGYQLDNSWRINAGLGYGDSDASTSRGSNEGVTWNLGANWTPNPRTNASVSFGESYWGEAWSGAISHATRRTELSVKGSRSLTNSSTLLAESASFGIFDPDGTPVVDPIDGDPLVVDGLLLTETDENYINTSLGVDIALTGRRSSITGSVTYQEREFDVSGEREDTIAYRLKGSRNLSGATKMTAGIRYADFSSSNAADDDTLDFTLGITNQLGRFSQIGASLSHRIFNSSDDSDYTEQRLSLTFTTRFL